MIYVFFDPAKFSQDRHRDLDQDIFRVGARFSPSPQSDLITSLIFGNLHWKLEDRLSPESDLSFDSRSNQHGIQGEGQHLFRSDRFNTVLGFAAYDINFRSRIALTDGPTLRSVSSTIDHHTLYAYLNAVFPSDMTWTIGFSYDKYDHYNFDISSYDNTTYSPKIGLQWDMTKAIRLRLAAFQAVKPAFFANRTIQPTQLAGFNQFYDGVNGTTSWNYDAGFDARIAENVYGGLEFLWRDLDVPAPSPSGKEFNQDQKEQLYHAYLYWTPDLNWAIRSGVAYDVFGSEKTRPLNFPYSTQIETLSFPIAVRYFNALGFFAGVGTTFVRQDLNRQEGRRSPKEKIALLWSMPRRAIVFLSVAV